MKWDYIEAELCLSSHPSGLSRPHCRWGAAYCQPCNPPEKHKVEWIFHLLLYTHHRARYTRHPLKSKLYPPETACGEGGGLGVLLGDLVLGGVMLLGDNILNLATAESLGRPHTHSPAKNSYKIRKHLNWISQEKMLIPEDCCSCMDNNDLDNNRDENFVICIQRDFLKGLLQSMHTDLL